MLPRLYTSLLVVVVVVDSPPVWLRLCDCCATGNQKSQMQFWLKILLFLFYFIVMQCCGLSVNIEPLLYVVGLAINIQKTIHYFLLQVR
jgi:hypothetical protein